MPPSRGRVWLVAAVATLAMTVSYADRQVLAVIGTSVRQTLGIGAEQFGWLAAAFSAAYLVCTPLAGVVLDRFGARLGLVVAVLVWSLVSAAHAWTRTFGGLLALRIALGIAESPSFPAAALAVRRALPAGDRTAAFGLLFTGSSLGAAIAGSVAPTLDARMGYQSAFWVTALLGLAWLPLWLAVTRAPEIRQALAGPSVERTIAAPARDHRRALLDPAVGRAIVLVLGSAPTPMFVFIWFPQYLTLRCGIPKASIGHYIWLPPLMADAGMLVFGMLGSWRDRAARRRRSHVELVLAAAALDATLAILPRVQSAWPSALLVGIAAAGGGGLYTLLTADMMARVNPQRASEAAGLTAAAQSLTYVVLNPLVGHFVDRLHSFDPVVMGLGLLAILGAAAWCAMIGHDEGRKARHPC
jgi:ACS family hexuronate transporter-like MFS transporter